MKLLRDPELVRAINQQTDAMLKLANACESLERSLTDRMDVIEGRLDELKPKEQQAAVSSAVAGHKPWTQRRDSRWSTHFKVDELKSKLQKVS